MFCRDRDSAVIPPLELQVDIGGATAHYHSDGDKPKEEIISGRIKNGEESPTSGHSFGYSTDDVPSSSNHYFNPHCASTGSAFCDKIDGVRPSSHASVSFVDNMSTTGCLQKGSTLVDHGKVQDSKTSSPDGNFVIDSLSLHQTSAPLASFTEVQSDRPIGTSAFDDGGCEKESSSESTSTGIISIIQKTPFVGPKMMRPIQIQHFSEDDSTIASECQEHASTNNSTSSSLASGICETTVLIEGASMSSSSS